MEDRRTQDFIPFGGVEDANFGCNESFGPLSFAKSVRQWLKAAQFPGAFLVVGPWCTTGAWQNIFLIRKS